jgi:hypothetical protein
MCSNRNGEVSSAVRAVADETIAIIRIKALRFCTALCASASLVRH